MITPSSTRQCFFRSSAPSASTLAFSSAASASNLRGSMVFSPCQPAKSLPLKRGTKPSGKEVATHLRSAAPEAMAMTMLVTRTIGNRLCNISISFCVNIGNDKASTRRGVDCGKQNPIIGGRGDEINSLVRMAGRVCVNRRARVLG